jgi:hypothetical protein
MAPIGACSPDDVLDRDGKSEIRGRQREVPGHQGQEQPEALAHPHAELRSTAAPVKIGRVWPKLPREIVVLGIAEVPAVRRGHRVTSGDATAAESHGLSAGIRHPES